jgi:hypothetical protein
MVEAHNLALATNGGVSMEIVTLYRAVSEGEFQQLMRTGKFEAVPSSLEGKFFAESAEDAAVGRDAGGGKSLSHSGASSSSRCGKEPVAVGKTRWDWTSEIW